MKRYVLFAGIALFCSYSPMWAKFYVELFQRNPSSNQVKLVAQEVTEPGVVEYRANLTPSDSAEVLTLGVVWPKPTVTCDGRYLQVAGTSIASDKNSVTSFTLPESNACRELHLHFRKTPGYFLYGIIGGSPFTSNSETAASYKRIVDFFFGDLRLLLLVVVLVYISLLMHSGARIDAESERLPIERYSIPWGLFLLTSAGVFEILLPWENIRSEIPKLNSYFSAIAHLGPGMDYIWRRFRKKPPSVYVVGLLFCFILFVPDRMSGFVSIGFPIGLATLFATVNADYIGPYRLYSILLLANFMKLAGGFGIDPIYLPHFHVVSVYIGLVIANSLLKKVITIGKVSDFISWANVHRASKHDRSELGSVLSKGLETTSAKKVHLIISEGESLELHSVEFGDSSNSVVSVENVTKLPPVFAAAITSAAPIWLVEEGSPRAINLHKGASLGNEGFFTVVPLKISGSSVAAVCFSGLQGATEPEELIVHKKVCSLFVSHLESFIESANSFRVAKNNEKLIEIVRHFSETEDARDPAVVIQESFVMLSKGLQCAGVFFAFDNVEDVFVPQLYTGLGDTSGELATNLFVKMNASNEHGPFILAVRDRKPIFVNNISLIEDVLRGRTSAFLQSCGSKSLAIFPILATSAGSSEEGSSVQYVQMFQSTKVGFFTETVQNLLFRYGSIVERYLSLKRMEEIKDAHQEALKEFVPPDVAERFISGGETRIESYGFLGCLDLIGSTELLRKYGDQWFRRIANKLVTQMSEMKAVKLASMNWDAYYFQSEDLADLIKLYAFCKANLSKFTDDNNVCHALKFRLCISHGDTSQDFCEANGFKRWTIVGSAMANVCKFEQRVKSAGEGVFLDEAAEAICGKSTVLRRMLDENGKVYFVIDERDGSGLRVA